MRKKYEELKFTDDFMFHKVMDNLEICKTLLETILDVEIERVEHVSYQKVIEVSVGSKGVRLDVYLKENVNKVYDIEMQILQRGDLPKRSRYYQGAIDIDLLDKGSKYADLPSSMVIFLCGFDLFEAGLPIYRFTYKCDADTSIELGDETAKIFVNAKGSLEGLKPGTTNFLKYMKGESPGDDFTRKLEVAVDRARRNEEWRAEYMTLDMKMQESYEDGLKDGKKEAVYRMIEGGKLTDEEISEYQGMSLEEVRELRKEMKN